MISGAGFIDERGALNHYCKAKRYDGDKTYKINVRSPIVPEISKPAFIVSAAMSKRHKITFLTSKTNREHILCCWRGIRCENNQAASPCAAGVTVSTVCRTRSAAAI